MNRRSLVITLCLVALTMLCAVWMPAFAAPRQCVILEGFTQWNCPPCAGWNPTETTLMEQMTRDTVISVKYHGWWPGQNNDPFHLWNVAESTARINMYGVSGVPDTRIDGYITPSFGNVTSFRNNIRNEYNNVDCPCSIDIAALMQGETSVFYTGSITAEESVSGKRLFVALLTDYVHGPPYGTNGEVDWHDIFRDMSPNASTGTTLTANAGETEEFEGTLDCEEDWDVDNMTVVAWVQDIGTQQILQGANTSVTQDYGLLSSSTEVYQQYVNPADQEIVYEVSLQNVGNLEDNYEVELLGDFPAGWSHSIEAVDVPAHETSIQVPLASLETSTIIVRLNTNGYRGYLDFAVEIASPNQPLVNARHDFRIMGGLNILLVDDDSGSEFETYFMDALTPYAEANSVVVGQWDVERDFLDNTYFNDIDVIVWMTGNSWEDGETITSLDQLILGDYLNGGGRLFLTGQGIGFDIRTDQFMSEHLHAVYGRNYPQGSSVLGIPDDPISDGLDTPITGGDGASNQTRQSILRTLDEFSAPLFMFPNDSVAALSIETPLYRAIYLGFGFEAIASAQTRVDLMGRSLEWLYVGLDAGETPSAPVPAAFALGQNFPNPFNPETTIPYTLADRSMITLSVYDVLGREVSQLVSEVQEAGTHSISWNASSLSSGIYFYTLNAANGTQNFRTTRKLVLMK